MSSDGRGTRVPQQRRSREKRAKLVETAYRLFGCQGYHSTSTNDIVRESGLSTGTLYAYFGNKKELFLEAVQIHYEILFDALAGALSQVDTADPEILKKVLPSTLYANAEALPFHRELVALMFTDDDVEKAYHAHQEALLDLVQSHLTARGLAVSREGAFLMVSVVKSIGREFLFHPETTLDRPRLDDISERVARQLLLLAGTTL